MPGSSTWPEPVERVSAALRAGGAEARIEEFPEGAHTAEEAAAAIGCELRRIVKSLLFDCDGSWVLVLLPGDRRADQEKVARATSANRARVAGAAQVRDATGFEPGAVAPFPLPKVESVFIERTMLGQPVVWIGAGSESHMAALSPAELVRLSRARSVDVVESHT